MTLEGADLELFERSLRHATQSHSGGALDDALRDLGWHDALGFDLRAAVSLHFELQGRAGATSSALDALLAHALGVDAPAVVLPAVGGWTPPGERSGDRVRVDGLTRSGADAVLVAATDGDKAVAAVVAIEELTIAPVRGVDPDLGLTRVTGDVALGDAQPVDWDRAVELARVALAHELVGASRTMLELARTHALERVQFDRPIASFQAVRHKLAEALVAIETAAAVLDATWLDPGPQTAAIAKAVAGRSARTVAKHCQQVLAGIGFTTEHPFHRYLRRVLVLDELFGAARTLAAALGHEVLETHRLPRLLEL